MKRLLSLIMAASILLQVVIPVGSKVTYAQTVDYPYNFQWERGSGLAPDLGHKDAAEGTKESLVSWEVGSKQEKFQLEYFVEKSNKTIDQVNFTFKQNADQTRAEVEFQVSEIGNLDEEREYQVYNFNLPNTSGQDRWEKQVSKDGIVLKGIIPETPYPGGAVKVGDMTIRFRWEGNKVYFQTDNINYGNITPFSLHYEGDSSDKKKIIEVLTGLDGYAVSPIHIDEDKMPATIEDKPVITVPGTPGTEERPGSKPGLKVEFKAPKQWDKDKGEFTTDGIKDLDATLELKGLMHSMIQLRFNLDKLEIDRDGKILVNQNGTISFYLTKDGAEHPNIVKWEGLDESMTLQTPKLSLTKKANEGLGIFTPQRGKEGHTYLGYTIKRSSIAEAFMEIQPYSAPIDTEFTYIIKAGSDATPTNMETIVKHTHMTKGDAKEETFTVPVQFAADFSDQYYQITIVQGTVERTSQILHYRPKEDTVIPPPTPVIQSVDNIYVVPPLTGDDPEAIGFDLTWSAPRNNTENKFLETLLNQGDIYYELFFHKSLEETKEKDKLINVFRASLDEGKVGIEAYAGTAGKDKKPILRYDPIRNTFTMENIVLKNPGEGNWEQVYIENPEYEKGKEYPDNEKDEIIAKDDMDAQKVPGIYYLTMRAIHTTGGEIERGISHTSNPQSITISPLEEVIPVPTKIESKHIRDEPDMISQSFSWDNVNLDRYIKQMLDPLNLKIAGEKGVYEIYLYQDKDINEAKLIEKGKTSPNRTIIDGEDLDKFTGDEIEILRNSGIIRLDYTGSSDTGMNNIVLKGLDPNQVYYATIRVRLDLVKDEVEVDPRHSVFSEQHSFTTDTKPSEPGPGERVPPVPENLQIVDQPNNTTAKIGWEAPEYTKQEDEVMYYEMLRVDSRKLAKEEDSRLLSIKKLLGDAKEDEMQAWRTKKETIDEYMQETDKWSELIPQQPSNKLQLEDAGLNPNQIYYYYVRTVLIVEEEEVYSSWVGIPVTTDPIQKPIQLKVEDKEDYSHDPKKEIVVSFLAPIPQGADIPSEYDFDIAVQGELDDDYRLDYSTSRVTSTMDEKDIPTGYSHYVYKIRNLKPGKRYDIKVRVIDKVVDIVNGEYPKSLYSDRVTTRTHFDQDEQDKDDKFEEYLKYFEDKVEALRRKPYWTLEDKANSFSIKYRSNYIMPEISSSNAYQLEVREGVSDFRYYMPANVISSANLSQTSFEIKQDNVTYSVRPSTITTELEELKVALKDISEKYIRDYYVVFNFSQRPNRGGTGFLTPEITVDIELARLKEEDLFIEDDIMVELNQRIDREKTRFINELERALDRGKILDEELEVIMNKSLEAIQSSHQRDVRSIVSRSTHRVVSIDNWSKSMLIMATIEGNAVAEGYLLGRQDTALTTFNVGGGYGIEISKAGTYAFKGQKITIPVIPGAPGAGDLVGKYQLTDFFGINGNIDPSRPVSKRNVLGAIARVLGAPRGADYIQYLKQMNIKGINNIGMDLPIKQGEGIYLLMQVYEKTHKKPISSVYIKNRNAVSNIRQFNQLHQPYVLVGVDSKIISQGGGIKPNDAMPTKDVLQVLTNIMATVR